MNGHDWQVRPKDRIYSKTGCPSCFTFGSKDEDDVAKFVESLGLGIVRCDRVVLNGLELDIWVPSLKIGIEFNGLYWHSDRHKNKTYHYDKWKACADKGIALVQIWENDWQDSRLLVELMLQEKLGFDKRSKIDPGDCQIVMPSESKANTFFDSTCLDVRVSGCIFVGLEHAGVLVSCIALAAKGEGWVIKRFGCSVRVDGELAMMLDNFRESHHGEVVAFSDLCNSDGVMFEGAGFCLDKVVPPDYKYYKQRTLVSKFSLRKSKFEKDEGLIWGVELSVSELAKLNGFRRVYDVGYHRWLLK